MKIKRTAMLVVITFLMSSLLFGCKMSPESIAAENTNTVSEEVTEVSKPAIHSAKPSDSVAENTSNTETETETEVSSPAIHSAKPPTTTESDIKVESEPVAQEEIKDTQTNPVINNKTTLDITKYDIITTDVGTLYEFASQRTVGSYGVSEKLYETLDYEAYFGIETTFTPNMMILQMYSHTSVVTEALSIKVVGYGGFDNEYSNYVGKEVAAYQNVEPNKLIYTSLDTLPNGVYQVIAQFIAHGKNHYTIQHVYINGTNSQACKLESKSAATSIQKWYNFTADININEMLEMHELTYPQVNMVYMTDTVHVDEWAELSHEIIQNDNWSDSMKVWMFVDYLRQNYAYDSWKVAQGVTRARYAVNNGATSKEAYGDDNNYMYYNGVGVCVDFVNALTIMCREHGIPCTEISTDSHTLNIVYIDGFWVPIDISTFTEYNCCEQDTSILKYNSDSLTRINDHYGDYVHAMRYAQEINNVTPMGGIPTYN